MADGIKTYKIVINGITESIDAIDSLNRQLDVLSKKIDELSSKTIKIATSTSPSSSTGGGSNKSSSKSSLTEEEKLERQIAQIDEKREAYSKSIYQNYLAAKDVLKETLNDQKQIAAQERLQANNYTNTMQGLKQKLADIKNVMQTTDIGSDIFQKYTKEANEITNKLKELEQATGQFGRNVGNYASAFDSIGKLPVTIGGVTKEFNSAREASRALLNALVTLEAQGKGNTAQAQQLRTEYYNLKSVMDDATKSSKAMDNAMDYMQSFTAMASIGNGFKAFFGFDDNEITKSIQKLVALQGVLQGLETIRKQMETKEGIGKILGEGFEKIDVYAFSLKRLNVSLNGTGAAARVMAAGINVAKVALKGLMSIGLVGAISLAMECIQKLVTSITNWVKGNADLVTSEQRLKIALDLTNDALERNLKLNQAKYNAKEINSVQLQEENEKAYARAIAETNKELEKRLKLDPKNSTFAKGVSNAGRQSGVKEFLDNDKGVTTFGGFDEAAKDVDELMRRYKALNEAVKNNTGLVYKNAKGIEIAHLTASDAKDELNHIEQYLAGNMVGAMKAFDLATAEGRKGLQNFVTQIMNSDNEIYKSLLMRLPEIVSNEKGQLGDGFKQWLAEVKKFVAGANTELKRLNFKEFANSILDAADETGERLAKRQKEELTARYKALSKEEQKQEKKRYEDALAAIDKNEAKKRQKTTNNYKKLESEVREAENDLNNLRISNMKEGLNKVIKQLEEERKQRLAKVQADGRFVNERQLEINKLYDKKIAEEKKKHAEEVVKIYDTMYKNILAKQIESQQKLLETNRADNENIKSNFEKNYSDILFDQSISSYGIQAKNAYSPSTQKSLGFTSTINDEMVNDVKKLIDLKREAETLSNTFYTAQKMAWSRQIELTDETNQQVIALEEMHLAKLEKSANDAIDILNNYIDALKEKYTSEEDILKQHYLESALLDEGYYNSLDTAFNQRLSLINRYWAERWSITTDAANKEYDAELKLLKDKKQQEADAENDWYDKQDKLITEWYYKRKDQIKAQAKSEKWSKEKLNEELDALDKKREKEDSDALAAHTANLEAIAKEYATKEKTLNRQRIEKLKQENAEYFQETLQEFRDFQTAISNLESKQPVYNSWGLINGKETNKNNRELLKSYETLIANVNQKRDELNFAFKNGLISKDSYESTLRELDSFTTGIGEKMDEVKDKLNWGNQIAAFLQSAQQYIQAGMDSFGQIMSAVWDAQDAQFDKEQEALDKENEMIQDALSKQDDMIEQHKNKVESIEDELANSRGARRQHLIDQLNAEMEAERRAQKEKERLQKQEELNKKKQEKLELERKKAEYDRNKIQAVVNGAMAITYAAMNHWPVPAIPLMALAASTTATQLAIMAANKPYAKGGILDDGGVAVGPRHRDGGIPVLGGRASIEGGEFITNRVTTQYNAPLLEYINSKKKRVDVTDLIDFYTGNKVRSNISAIKTKYADGGALPTLPNNLDIRDQISNVIVNQDNRPIYVTVTDIQNKMDDVKYVKTLAGLEG